MKGLLMKEWYSLRGMSNFKILAVLSVAFLLIGTRKSMEFMLIYLPILASMIPRMVLAYDENSKWEQFSLALPYSRKDIVTAKYLITFLLCAVCTVLSGIASCVSMAINGGFEIQRLLFILSVSIGASLIIPSFAFPIDMKYGSAKGRIFTFLYAAVMGLAGAYLGGAVDTEITLASLSGIMSLVPYFAAVAGLLLFSISWMISVRFYEKREF